MSIEATRLHQLMSDPFVSLHRLDRHGLTTYYPAKSAQYSEIKRDEFAIRHLRLTLQTQLDVFRQTNGNRMTDNWPELYCQVITDHRNRQKALISQRDPHIEGLLTYKYHPDVDNTTIILYVHNQQTNDTLLLELANDEMALMSANDKGYSSIEDYIVLYGITVFDNN